MTKKTLIFLLALYVISAAGSFAAFSYFGGADGEGIALPQGGSQEVESDDSTLLSQLLNIDPKAPKDQPCPLNGKMYTKVERDAWETRRPLYVMIENTPDARPQSGLSNADVVFEAVAEGGVTRFGAMYYCDAQSHDVTLAPIRSARSYFIDWASGFNNPLYVHVGGANIPGPADALGQLADYGWNMQNDINQFSVGFPTFVRDYNRIPGKEVATEHTMVTSTEKLWAVGEKRGWTNMSPDRKLGRTSIPGTDWKDGYTGWTFEDSVGEKGSVSSVAYDFWSGYGDYSVKWIYKADKDSYDRGMGGEDHLDLNNNKIVSAANVVVLLTTEKGPIDEKKHMLYGTIGSGDALIFKHGQVTKATWSKKSREAELQFSDSKGKAFEFARGPIWISVINKANQVTY